MTAVAVLLGVAIALGVWAFLKLDDVLCSMSQSLATIANALVAVHQDLDEANARRNEGGKP